MMKSSVFNSTFKITEINYLFFPQNRRKKVGFGGLTDVITVVRNLKLREMM